MEIKKRFVYIDLLKFIAIFAVVFNHASINYFNANDIIGEKIFYSVFEFLVSIHIPLFLIISGAVVLSKDYDLMKVIKKVVFIIIACFAFQVLWQVLLNVYKGNNLTIHNIINGAYSDNPFQIIWYFSKIYVPFLLLVPALQIVVKKMTKEHFIFYTILFVLFKIVLRVLEKFFGFNICVIDSTVLISDVLFLPIFGYFIHSYDFTITNKKLLAIIVIAILSILLYKYIYPINVYNYILCGVLFIYFKSVENILQKMNSKCISYINSVAKNSVLIYIFHWFFCRAILFVIDKIGFVSPMSFHGSAFLITIIAFTLTNIFANVLNIFIMNVANLKNKKK